MGARRPALAFQLPMVIACLVLALSDAPAAIFVHMALMGMSAGAYAPVTASLLAEAYGVERLGAIRATAAAVMVLSTSLSPLVFGVLVDMGVAVDLLVAGLGLLAFVASAMLYFSGLTRRA
jgi:MFS family permease